MNNARTIKQQAAEHMASFMERHRAAWPHWIIITAIFAAGLVVAGLWLSIKHPAAGEIWQNQLISVVLVFVTITAGFLGFAIARGIYLSAPEITRDIPPALSLPEKVFLVFGVRIGDAAPALPAATWTPPDAHPDILICNLPGETPEQFAARVEDGIEQANIARWVVVLQKGNPAGMIYGAPDAAMEFLRDWPPFQTETWLPEQRIVPVGTRFRHETEEQFQGYVERFMEHYPEWAGRKKITGEKTRAGFVFQQVIKAASVVLFLLFSVAAFAQKAEQVAATPIANKVPGEGANVAYVFAQTDLYRTADGRKTFAELLTALPGYRNGGGGQLMAIMVDGKSVYKPSKTGDVEPSPATKAATMRPYSEAVNPDELGQSFVMPDSAGMVEMADRAKYEIWKASKLVEDATMPWWEVVMYGFWRWSPFLALLMGISWFWASLGSDEGYWYIHRYAKNVLMIVSGSVATLFAINIYLWFVAQNAPTWVLYIVAAVEFGIAYLIVRKINPDYRPAKGNGPKSAQKKSGYYDQDQPQLNG